MYFQYYYMLLTISKFFKRISSLKLPTFLYNKKKRQATGSVLSSRVINPWRLPKPKKSKRLLSFREVKTFGSLQLLVIPENTWESLMPYICFILRIKCTYVIWMKVFFGKKRNGFCLETPCFFMASKYLFVQSFVSVWVNKLNSFCLADAAFFAIFIVWVFFGIPTIPTSVTIDSAYREAVFDLKIPSCLLLHTKLSIYFSLSWETKAGFLVIVLVGTPFRAECSGDIKNVQEIFLLSLNLYFAPILLLFFLFKKKLAIFC